MKWLDIYQPPVSLHGLASWEENHFFRLPAEVIDNVSPEVSNEARNASGGRIRFSTNSKELNVLYTPYFSQSFDYIGGASFVAKNLIAVYVDNIYLGPTTSKCDYDHGIFKFGITEVESHIFDDGKMHEITIYLPILNSVSNIKIGLADEATVGAAHEYTYKKPLVFYGSSIVHGHAASHAGITYVDKVCRRLDTEYINLGFGGAAKGEATIRDYIASLDMNAFVLDYDHNAPSPEHLQATHEPFFLAVREKHPDLPILMMSRPDFKFWRSVDGPRREIIRTTYENALKRGDGNVWFIDGESFFGYGEDRYDCTNDGLHPNDLGFERMANVITPVVAEMLERTKGEALK